MPRITIKDKIANLFGIRFHDNLSDLKPVEYENYIGNKILKKDGIFNGNCQANLILEEHATVTISGDFHGNIIGKKHSQVIIKGKFEGIVFCNQLRFAKSCQVNGAFYVNQRTVIEDGANIHGVVKDLFVMRDVPDFDSWDLAYIASEKFNKRFQILKN